MYRFMEARYLEPPGQYHPGDIAVVFCTARHHSPPPPPPRHIVLDKPLNLMLALGFLRTFNDILIFSVGWGLLTPRGVLTKKGGKRRGILSGGYPPGDSVLEPKIHGPNIIDLPHNHT